MTTSRTDIDTSWADTGHDDGQPQRRQTGMDGHDPESFDPAALVADLPPRDGTAATPSQANFDDLGIRPEWHSGRPPAPVAAAWQSVEEAVEAATEAERAERALDGEEAQAQRTEAARVRSATASGKVVKAAAPGRDFPAERRHSAAVASGHRLRARKCRGEYEILVEQHAPDWAATIVASLPSAKASALEALTEAGLQVERLLADAEAAQTMLRVEGGSVVSLPTFAVRQCAASMQALADTIEASAQLAGVDLCRPRMEPSWSERQRIGASLLHGVVDSGTFWLAELERREQYRLSSFTRGIPLGERPSEVTQW